MKYQQGDVLFLSCTEEEWDKYVDLKTTKVAVNSQGEEYQQERDPSHTTRVYKGGQKKFATVALGEVTGHSHAVNMSEMLDDCGITLYDPKGWNNQNRGLPADLGQVPEFVEIIGSECVFKHEEHDPVAVPPGKYMVRIVKEFDHVSRINRYVAD